MFSDAYQLTAASSIGIDSLVEGTGQYTVRATVDGGIRNVDTTESIDGAEGCIGVRFSLLDNGSVDYWTKSMRTC